MLCLMPVRVGLSGPFACGRCDSCLINRKRDWVSRLLLHHCGHHGESAFVTLTYRSDECPVVCGFDSLSRIDCRNFLQRFRREVGSFRYVLVGEYGDRTGRPHYHALLWWKKDCDPEELVKRCWPHGFVSVGEVSRHSVQYTVSYVLKGMTHPFDVSKALPIPQFARFSHGLGKTAMDELKRCARVNSEGLYSLPREFRLDGKVWPVPKYIRRKLEEDGYVFDRTASEKEEERFVLALRAGSKGVAFEGILEFRSSVAEEVERRRGQSKVRISRKLIGERYETLEI